MRITAVRVEQFRVPLPRRGRVPLAGPAPPAGPTAVDVLAVHVQTDAAVTGLGVTTVVGPGVGALRWLLETDLIPLVAGDDGRDIARLYAKAEAHFGPVGFAGLPARAYAAIDLALWDIAGKAAAVTVGRLLGHANPAGAGYFRSDPAGPGWAAADVAQLAKAAMKHGATGVRVECGTAAVQADADRVRELHDALGEDAWVGVAAGGRYDLSTALALAHFFEDQGVDWLEDPLPTSDAAGYARLADRLELPVAVGSRFGRPADFTHFLRDGLARVVRPDALRLGGLTPVRAVCAVAAAFHAAVVPVRLPEVAAHLGVGVAGVTMIDSVPWLGDLLTGGPVPAAGGKLVPGPDPGFGWRLSAGAGKFAV